MANYFSIAYQFLNLTQSAISEMEKQGNNSMIFSSPIENEQLAWRHYDDATRWNDHRIGIRVLFNFYHGLELLMKALLYHRNREKHYQTHKLTGLLEELRNSQNPYPAGILEILETHLSDHSPFNKFFTENNLSVDSYFEILKYPESNRERPDFKYLEITYTGNKGLVKYKRIKDDINTLREEIKQWNKV